MKRPSLPFLGAVFLGVIAAADVLVGVISGNWLMYVAAGFAAAASALNLHTHLDSRKARRSVAIKTMHHPGGSTSSDIAQAYLRAVERAALTTATVKTSTPPAPKKPEAFHGLPYEFAVGEVYGLRMWHMDQYGRLRARNWEGAPPWRPGVNHAKCVRRVPDDYRSGSYRIPLGTYSYAVSDNPGHDVPSEKCSCGFYAYTDSLHAEVKSHARSSGEPVLGIIKGTGRTLIGTQGFRCEKAEIVAFRDPTRGGTKHDEWRTRQLAHLRRVYPDVPILATRAALLEFAPLTDTAPDPTSDDFWSLP